MEDMKDIIKPGYDITHSIPLGCFGITQKIDTKVIEL